MDRSFRLLQFFVLLLVVSCSKNSGNDRMATLLQSIHKKNSVKENFFRPEIKKKYHDSLAVAAIDEEQRVTNKYLTAYYLLQAGEPEQAIEIYEKLLKTMDVDNKEARRLVHSYLGLAYMRLGEQLNCISRRAAESCIFPIRGHGIHPDDRGARKAIENYEIVLNQYPDDLESRWLLNLAYMSLGIYPDSVPPNFLIPGMDLQPATVVKPFLEIAGELGLDINNMSGGSITEDFDGDGYLDIATSSWSLDEEMHFFRNDGKGSFIDQSQQSQLDKLTGGLNMVQTDYNNDGYADVLVLRGGWMGKYGEQPNSLLKNNGDGTFSDVTQESGMLSFHPTQTATWNDFNNDGWLDVFIGNESREFPHPCELFINQKDGTFINVAAKTGSGVIDFVKGVTSGDYDNDGWQDIFISTMNNRSYLLKNMGIQSGNINFEDVTTEAGLHQHNSRTFPTWFWDYDNDGWLDIFLCAYDFQKSLGFYEASVLLNQPMDPRSRIKLFHNNKDGTFTDVAQDASLDHIANAMGSNFGDIDNDGFLDAYLGTGNPDSKSVVPNKMFRNISGKKFEDVSAAARVAHLQKGHGVSFADLDNDGDQDVHMEVGGSFKGDSYQNSFYLNPGYDNNWICLQLQGKDANRVGIGSRIKLSFVEGGVLRTVYRDVNSGGSFGASPLRREIGIGKATVIYEIEIRWSGSNRIQKFTNIAANQFLKITEGNSTPETLKLSKITWQLNNRQFTLTDN